MQELKGAEEVEAKHLYARLGQLKIGLQQVVESIPGAVFKHEPHWMCGGREVSGMMERGMLMVDGC